MPAERYFLTADFHNGQSAILEGTEFHHLVNVMRSQAGESVELVNGRGSLAKATIERLEKKKAHLVIDNVFVQEPQKDVVILAQAIPRINRLDFILEKGTELGMTHVWLFPGDRSERKNFTESQLERLPNICISAMKQCGRLYVPEISLKPVLSKWTKPEHSLYFGDVHPEAPLLENVMKGPRRGIIFCVGPESGFSDQEENVLRSLGGTGVKLHHNILRTDTAAVAALAIITHRF